MKKVIAEFTKWNGEKQKIEIKRDWAEGIAYAVEGQFFFADKVDGFSINGSDFAKVDIYEIESVEAKSNG